MEIRLEEKYQISSIESFFKINAAFLYARDAAWIFRGHSDINYKLLPGIGRLLDENVFQDKEKLLKYEESAFNQFQIAVYPELKEQNPYILLAVAQHHGLKTRLLDWTMSPLHALFFAVESKPNIAGALIAFQPQSDYNYQSSKGKCPFHIDQPYDFVHSPSLSPRIKAQKGVFQVFQDPFKEFQEGYNLQKFIIPAKFKGKIKHELYDIGISYDSLFPDIDGICKAINFRTLKDE